MLLDQSTERKKISVISGNNQLLKGAVFAVVSLVWFSLLFVYIDVDWNRFSPFSPFGGERSKEDFVFYFVCFSFFIVTLIFSTVFYRNNLQPSDLLLRFAIILIVFFALYLIYTALSSLFVPYIVASLKYLNGTSGGMNAMSIFYLATGFFFLYFLFFPLTLFFSQVFFNGYFGLAGYILCFFITAVFIVLLWLLGGMAQKLAQTPYPMNDLAMIIFFTFLSFAIGVSSGEEEKKKRTTRLNSPTDRLKGSY